MKKEEALLITEETFSIFNNSVVTFEEAIKEAQRRHKIRMDNSSIKKKVINQKLDPTDITITYLERLLEDLQQELSFFIEEVPDGVAEITEINNDIKVATLTLEIVEHRKEWGF